MFKNRKKYLILLVLAVGFSACSSKQKIITIRTDQEQQHQPRPQAEVIKEEILIKDNPNLGNRVSVPKNHPTLGSRVLGAVGGELTGEKMERMAFPADEYRQLKIIGRSIVSGSVYLQNSMEDRRVTKKKIRLLLNPVTSYSKQWYQESYLGGYKLSPVDKRISKYLKVEYSNEDGAFRFFGVPRGSYYLIAQISCGAECGYSSNRHIRLVKEIFVGSDVKNIELMKNVP